MPESQKPIIGLKDSGDILASFFKENVRYLVWTYRDVISLILGTRFPLILQTR